METELDFTVLPDDEIVHGRNHSLVRRLLEQMGNPGDAIFAAAGRR
jgi:hypothetical protein